MNSFVDFALGRQNFFLCFIMYFVLSFSYMISFFLYHSRQYLYDYISYICSYAILVLRSIKQWHIHHTYISLEFLCNGIPFLYNFIFVSPNTIKRMNIDQISWTKNTF